MLLTSCDCLAFWVAKKLDDKNGFEWLEYQTRGCDSEIAEKGDWLCQDPNGDWHVLSDEEHRKEVNNGVH